MSSDKLSKLRQMRKQLEGAVEKGEGKKAAEGAAKPKPGAEPPLVEGDKSTAQGVQTPVTQEGGAFEQPPQIPASFPEQVALQHEIQAESKEEQPQTVEAAPESAPAAQTEQEAAPQTEASAPVSSHPVSGEENLVERVTDAVLGELGKVLKPLRDKIAELRAELEGTVNGMGDGLDELNSKVEEAQAMVTGLGKQVNGLDTNLTSVEQKAAALEGKASTADQKFDEMEGSLEGVTTKTNEAHELALNMQEQAFNLRSNVDSIEERTAALEAGAKAVDKQFGTVGDSFDELNGKIEQTQATANSLKGQVDTLETGLDEAKNGLATTKAELKADVKSAGEDLGRVDKKLTGELAKLRTSVTNDIKAKAAEQQARVGEVESELKAAQADAKTVGNRVIGVEERVDGLEARADSAGEKFDEVGTGLDELSGVIEQVQSKANETKAQVRSQGTELKKQGDALVDIAGDHFERAKSIGEDNAEVTKKALVLVLVDDDYAESLGSDDMRKRGPNTIHAKLQEIANDTDYVRELLAQKFYQVEPGQLKAHLRDRRNAKVAKWLNDKTKTVMERARNCAGGDV